MNEIHHIFLLHLEKKENIIRLHNKMLWHLGITGKMR